MKSFLSIIIFLTCIHSFPAYSYEASWNETNLNHCLDEYWKKNPKLNSCWQAILDLSKDPYDNERKEMILALIDRLSSIQWKYRSTLNGLSKSLKSSSHIPSQNISGLELKAWQKALQRLKVQSPSIFLNGTYVPMSNTWKPPMGIFQWVIVSDSHQRFSRIGTWPQFASAFVSEAVVSKECDQTDLCAQNISLGETVKSIPTTDHLPLPNSLPVAPKESRIEGRWVFPILTFVALGLAAGLKNKRVTAQW